jgi:hypothetical protein
MKFDNTSKIILEEHNFSYYELSMKSLIKYAYRFNIRAGIMSLVYGLVQLFYKPTINLILVFIGFCLIIEALWFIFSPSPIGILVNGITMIIIGILFIIKPSLLIEVNNKYYNLLFYSIGIILSYYGIQHIIKYRKLLDISCSKPS